MGPELVRRMHQHGGTWTQAGPPARLYLPGYCGRVGPAKKTAGLRALRLFVTVVTVLSKVAGMHYDHGDPAVWRANARAPR